MINKTKKKIGGISSTQTKIRDFSLLQKSTQSTIDVNFESIEHVQTDIEIDCERFAFRRTPSKRTKRIINTKILDKHLLFWPTKTPATGQPNAGPNIWSSCSLSRT